MVLKLFIELIYLFIFIKFTMIEKEKIILQILMTLARVSIDVKYF